MKDYMVAYLSFFDNDMQMVQVKATSEYEAIKKAMVEISSEDTKQEEIDFQNSEDYPANLDEQKEYYFDADLAINVKEITH